VSSVLAAAVERRTVHDGAINLAFGSRTSLLGLIEELEQQIGHAVERRHVDPRPGDVRDSQADNTVLRSLFPDVTPTGLREGLAATVAWFRSAREDLTAHGAGSDPAGPAPCP
jgi:UDP-glucose 4-epimerase